MYELTFISGRRFPGIITSLTSPNVRTMVRLQTILTRCGFPCRLWHKSRGACELIG